ncbi:hypothetical protein EJ06DRAFT_291804 [Trichodelitschia bisporula]|uniref:Uncharacterized protein n=1 Tax=Trichodelitschia bisporula TaxID=703511 RepID=A0A6G1I653_9PEZI|nr:hypothetical protein EJ06DRAFT_291804 [Trichodelitschia bisporula]
MLPRARPSTPALSERYSAFGASHLSDRPAGRDLTTTYGVLPSRPLSQLPHECTPPTGQSHPSLLPPHPPASQIPRFTVRPPRRVLTCCTLQPHLVHLNKLSLIFPTSTLPHVSLLSILFPQVPSFSSPKWTSNLSLTCPLR